MGIVLCYNDITVLYEKGDQNMLRQYWWILIIYILMQISSIFLPPILYGVGITDDLYSLETVALGSLISFTIALIPILILTKQTKEYPFEREEKLPFNQSFVWVVLGFFLAIFVQGLAGAIETYIFKIEMGSENTQNLVAIAKTFPAFFIVFTIIGPILEEIVFRKVIFGALYTRFNFWISVIISSIIFGIVHFEIEHLLIYTSMGATFAFLYVKTKRLIVPIMTHILMNTFASIVTFYSDDLEKYLEQLEQMQQFIGVF